jgi:hypothetical protein
MMRSIGLAGWAATVPTLAWAHPGHGTTEPASVEHYLFEPVHAVPLVVLAVAVAAAGLIKRRRARSADDGLARDRVVAR